MGFVAPQESLTHNKERQRPTFTYRTVRESIKLLNLIVISLHFTVLSVFLKHIIRREIVFAASCTAESVANLVLRPQVVDQRCFLLEDLVAYLADELKTESEEAS